MLVFRPTKVISAFLITTIGLIAPSFSQTTDKNLSGEMEKIRIQKDLLQLEFEKIESEKAKFNIISNDNKSLKEQIRILQKSKENQDIELIQLREKTVTLQSQLDYQIKENERLTTLSSQVGTTPSLENLSQITPPSSSNKEKLLEDKLQQINQKLEIEIKKNQELNKKILSYEEKLKNNADHQDLSKNKSVQAVSNKKLSHKVQRGESLPGIAKKRCGNMERWQEIYMLNQTAIKDPNKLHIGITIKLPQDCQ